MRLCAVSYGRSMTGVLESSSRWFDPAYGANYSYFSLTDVR